MGIGKYVGIGVAALFALYGGCDHIAEKYLKRQYSEKLIESRQKAAEIISENVEDSIESIMESIEKCNREKRVQKW